MEVEEGESWGRAMGGAGNNFLRAVGGGGVRVEVWGRLLIGCGDEDAQTAIIFSKRLARWFGPVDRLGDQNGCAIILALASGRRLDANLIQPFPYVSYVENLITMSNTIKFTEHNHLIGHSTCLICIDEEKQRERERERCQPILCICTSCVYVSVFICMYLYTYVFVLCVYICIQKQTTHAQQMHQSLHRDMRV